MSPDGLKLHFTVDIKAEPMQKFWVRIPHPKNPKLFLQKRVETRWYDDQAYTLGVSFLDMAGQDKAFLKGYMHIFKKLGREEC